MLSLLPRGVGDKADVDFVNVTDIAAEYARLKAAGMVFHCPPQTRSGLRVTYGRDPDGNVVELLEVTDRESMPVVQAG